MLYEAAVLQVAIRPFRCPSLRTLKLRKGGELVPWYERRVSEAQNLRKVEAGPGTCVSCGAVTWMELDGEVTCHECAERLRFAGYPLGFRETERRKDSCLRS